MTTGYCKLSSLKYQTYYDLLINACVRYDRTKKANIAKRGHIYQTFFTPNNDGFISHLPSQTPDSDPYMGIDTPSDEFYTINTNQSGPPMSARHKLLPRLLRSNPNINFILDIGEGKVEELITNYWTIKNKLKNKTTLLNKNSTNLEQ